jgi:hypothetical protein
MLITKQIQTSIDLLLPNEIYALDLDQLLMDKLTARFVGKCQYSMLILKVKSILKKSSRRLVDNRLDGGAYVDVCCELEGQVFVQGEVLACKIVETMNNAITAEHDYAGIKLQKDSSDPKGKSAQILKILTKGQIVPVVVQYARYNLNKNKASIIAIPFIPNHTPYVLFNITSGLTPIETEKISYILDLISKEEDLHKVISKEKRYELFKTIMYPFKNLQKIEQSKEFSSWKMVEQSFDVKLGIDKLLEQFLSINNGYIAYPDEDHKLNRRYFHTDTEVKSDRLMINSPLFAVLSDTLYKYLLYLSSLRTFVETYSTLEKVGTLAVYLQICKEAQSE